MESVAVEGLCIDLKCSDWSFAVIALIEITFAQQYLKIMLELWYDDSFYRTSTC